MATGSASLLPAVPALALPSGADIEVTSTTPSDIEVGEVVSITFTVTNNGPEDATGVTFTHTIPSGHYLDSVAPISCTGDPVITCSLGGILASEDAIVTIGIKGGITGPMTAVGTGSANETDPTPGNNSASPNLSVTVNTDNASLLYGCTVIGTSGSDTITARLNQTPPEHVCGLAGADTLYGTNARDFLYGGDGADTLYGYSAEDVLMGGPGNDTLDCGTGKGDWWKESWLDPDTGTDTGTSSPVDMNLADTTPQVTGLGTDTVTNCENARGGKGDDTIAGTSSTNKLNGGAGGDTLFGLGGNDKLGGEAGIDVLYGGDGNDWARYQDEIYAGTSGVTVDLSANSASTENGTDNLAGIENVWGSPKNDTITGDGSDNWIYAVGGNDTINGGAGRDRLSGGEGNDTINGGDDNDALWDSDGGNDILNGGAGNDNLKGGPGNNDLNGGADNDKLITTFGTNSLDGGTGYNTVVFRKTGTSSDLEFDLTVKTPQAALSDETDTLVFRETDTGDTCVLGDTCKSSIQAVVGVQDVVNTISGDSQDNRIIGGASDDDLSGGGGKDTINGRGGDDTIAGNGGDDKLLGSTGDDYLTGGDGVDKIFGNSNVSGIPGDTCSPTGSTDAGDKSTYCETLLNSGT